MADIYFDVDTALSEVPVNIMPLIDDGDFKSIEGAVAYNAAGMALYWHFVTTAGAYTLTAVTPTTGGNYDWTDQGAAGIYTIEIPASGGASINNDTEGFGWFTGVATGILPWRGPVCGFRAAAINNSLVDGTTIDVNVTAMAANVLTATAINSDAITAAKLASDVTTELQSGLATAANLATVAGYIDTEIAAILADTNELQTDWADGGRLDLILDARASQSSVNTIDGIVDDILVDTAEIGAAGAGLTNINLPNQTMDIIGNITGNLSGSVGSVTGAVGSVTGNVGGNVTGSIGSLATQAKADVNAEADTALADVGVTTTVTGRIDAAISTRLASASYTAPDNSAITAIKAKTDPMTFTVSGFLDVNTQYINDVQLLGDGAGTPMTHA